MTRKKMLDPRKLPTMAPEEPPAPEPPLDAQIRPRRSDEPPEAQPPGPGALITREVLKEVAREQSESETQSADGQDAASAPMQDEPPPRKRAAHRRTRTRTGR